MVYALVAICLTGCNPASSRDEKLADIDQTIRLIKAEWLRERTNCQADAYESQKYQVGADCMRVLAKKIEADQAVIASLIKRRNEIAGEGRDLFKEAGVTPPSRE